MEEYDYMDELETEIDSYKLRIRKLLEEKETLIQEIDKLNNIIDGMEKFFKHCYDNEVKSLNDRKISVWTICLDKLQELLGE